MHKNTIWAGTANGRNSIEEEIKERIAAGIPVSMQPSMLIIDSRLKI